MVVFDNVWIYTSCQIETSPGVFTEYTEEGLHRPVFPAPVDSSSIPPTLRTLYRTDAFTAATPKKGHELDELEVYIDYDRKNPLSPYAYPKFICL